MRKRYFCGKDTGMRLLLTAATYAETAPFLKTLGTCSEVTENLRSYTLKKAMLDVLITGVGMVPAAFHLGCQLTRQTYDFVIIAGIAGSFTTDYTIGSVVHVVKEALPEMGAEDNEGFLSVFGMKLLDANQFPFEGGNLVNDLFENRETGSLADMENRLKTVLRLEKVARLKSVSGITVNTVHGRQESIDRVVSLCHPDVETMEGAASLYACLVSQTPSIQLRAISNRVEVRDRSKWDIPLAIRRLNEFLNQLFLRD